MKLKPCLLLLPTAILAACGGGGNGGHDDENLTHVAVVATRASDYSSGAVSLVETTSPFTASNGRNANASSDLVVRADGDHYFLLARYDTNTISRYDAATPNTPTYTYSTNDAGEENSNPYDLIVASPTKAYLLRYGSATIWIVDPSASSEANFKIGEIDLSAYDADGIPEMSAGVIKDGKLYVALQRLEAAAATQNGEVVVIDTAADAVSTTIDLPVRDPVRLVAVPDSDDLLVAADGGYDGSFGVQYDGGIVRIDTDDNSAELLIDDGDATTHPYGTLTDVVAVAAHRAYTIGSTGYFGTQTLYRFDPGATTVTPAAVDGFAGKDLGALAVDPDGQLWVTRTGDTAPGLTVLGFDGSTETVNKDLIDTELTPLNIDFVSAASE